MAQSFRPNCYIEFRIHDPERFELLQRFFKPLRDFTRNVTPSLPANDAVTTAGRGDLFINDPEDTQESQSLRDETVVRREFAKPEEWLLAFRPQDLDMLRMPSHREAIVVMRDWQGLSRRERRKAIKAHENSRQLRGLADFVDMLKYWQDVEFELVDLEQTDPDRARINYKAFDYPFQGKAALEELLMFFGFLSILRDSC